MPLSGRLLAEYYCGGVIFDHPDELGSATTATDCTGSNVQERLYYPFGESWEWNPSGSPGMHQEFAQLPDYDPETDQYNTLARHYTPMGRWLTPDPSGVKAARLDDPQTWNMYAYARSNPTTVTDPSGLEPAEPSGGTDSNERDPYTGSGGYTYKKADENGAGGEKKQPPMLTINGVDLEISKTSTPDTPGNIGMTITVTPTNCNECRWVQTVNSTSNQPTHTDFEPRYGSPVEPAPVLGNPAGKPNTQNVLWDSPSFPPSTQSGSKYFVSTFGVMNGDKFQALGSITWGFSETGGKVAPMEPRESTPAEQRGSLAIIKKEYPGVLEQ